MQKIKGVFFDLGGTLRICEKVPEHQEQAKKRMAELAGREDVQNFIDMVEERYQPYRDWALSENKEAGDFDLWCQWLLPEMEPERLRGICHELTYQYRQVKGRRRVVAGGLIGEYEIFDWLQEDGLKQYFDAVVLSSVCRIRKPDPRIYRLGCDELGLEPGECVSIADNLGRDITGAKAAGIGANILFISPEKLAKKTITDENRPDYIVHEFPEILDIPILQ